MSVQSLVDATIRHLEFRIQRPEVKHKKLHVRVHECNFKDYTNALAKRMSEMMGEVGRVLETPQDCRNVLERFRELHNIDFDYWQQVYLDADHTYVAYESSADTVMLFDCTVQIPNPSQLHRHIANRVANLEL